MNSKVLSLLIALAAATTVQFAFKSGIVRELQTVAPLKPICGSISPRSLLLQGEVLEAEKGYRCLTIQSEKLGYSKYWSSLMDESWYFHYIGDDKSSVELSHKALDLAVAANQQGDVGRSLSWLAWVFADRGFFYVSELLYRRAIEIGAPRGIIKDISLWGISTQDLGYLMMRQGDLDEGKRLLTYTINFARIRGIDIGVAEGSAYLAQILFSQGRYKESMASADEAIAASLRSSGAALITARSLAIKARILVYLAKNDPDTRADAEQVVQELINFSENKGINRFLAEGYLIQSELLPYSDFEMRLTLVSNAVSILQEIEKSKKHSSTVLITENIFGMDDKTLTEHYQKAGVTIQSSMFQVVDETHTRKFLSDMNLVEERHRERLLSLQSSGALAEQSGAAASALEFYYTGLFELSDLGYSNLAIIEGQKALTLVDAQLVKSSDPSARNPLLVKKMLIVQELGKNELLVKSPIQKEWAM